MWAGIQALAILALIMQPIGTAFGSDNDREEILALIDQAFDAIGSGDNEALRAIQLADGTSISFRRSPDGAAGQMVMRMTTNEELLEASDASGDTFVERWTAVPTVQIRGPIAVVWGEYEFWINNAFSHCGVDAINLVKLEGGWKIANWMWTVEEDGCPTGPDAP